MKRKMSIDFSEDAYRILCELAGHELSAEKAVTMGDAMAQAIRTALNLSLFLKREVNTGYKIFLEKEGSRKELVL